jgi:O-antigen/teichoic acid export membrane protein
MAIVAFFDMGYQCTKDTVRTLPAIVVGAIVNIVANVVLTPRWGVPGTLAAGILTYLVLVVYRWHDMRRYFTLRLQWRTALALAIVAVTAVVFYAQWPLWADVAAAVALLALCIACAPPRVRHLVVHRPRQ